MRLPRSFHIATMVVRGLTLFSLSIMLCLLTATLSRSSGIDQPFIQLKDFELVEVKSGGFSLPKESVIHIRATGGGGDRGASGSESSLFAYGWIINAGTRDLVWKMDRYNTNSKNGDRVFDGTISLPSGSYEVYFAAYAFSSRSLFSFFEMNIDRRNLGARRNDLPPKGGILPWLDDLFGGDLQKEWRRRAKGWGIELSAERPEEITMFKCPGEFPHMVFKATGLGENEHLHQGFVVGKPLQLRVYALGEAPGKKNTADYGWIIDARTRKRVWEMNDENLRSAGGAQKNSRVDQTLTFDPGEYILYFITDDSHSAADWNDAPPDDPLNYGITLATTNDADREFFKLSSSSEEKNIIVQLTRVRDNETRSATFSLKADAEVRIYAIGERGNARREMADYAWIMDAKTREKVWTMDVDHTEYAGGADKNRMVDEVISLPKGSYTVVYRSDDSHSYDDWNSASPADPEHWGITLYGAGDHFNMNIVEKSTDRRESGALVQIIQVGNSAKRQENFRLDKPTRVRIYAIGEGENREMFDYGWIENATTHSVVWEMTYSMTFHAGGGRKNRMVNTTILLEKGSYILHYVSDDSHSYDDWNTDPPDDPTMWGISVYRDE